MFININLNIKLYFLNIAQKNILLKTRTLFKLKGIY